MDVRHTPGPAAYRTMTNVDLRKHFLIDTLFVDDAVRTVYSDIDRSITGSAVPAKNALKLAASRKEMAADYFLERREIGIINIGRTGTVKVDGREFPMEHRDGLYIGRGVKEVEFSSALPGDPAWFYFVSFPAHAAYPTAHIRFAGVEPARLGSQKDANKRAIYKYIHPGGARSCQLVMGLTALEEGSVWNTMPLHTHQRRSEVYMYFDLAADAVVFHLIGEPSETKHIVMHNRQAVLSPIWSVHSGVGTGSYAFVWAMGGENQNFDDMDWVPTAEIG